MGNIIDFKLRVSNGKNSEIVNSKKAAAVVEISTMRNQMIRDDRRQVKRTILTEFISVHAVVPGRGVMRVMLYDINENGLSFDLESLQGHYNVSDEIELRVYLNHQTFFKIDTKVAHITEVKDEGCVRHGCVFVHESTNSEALSHFVKFLESVTASLKTDNGDILVTKINS